MPEVPYAEMYGRAKALLEYTSGTLDRTVTKLLATQLDYPNTIKILTLQSGMIKALVTDLESMKAQAND